MTSTKSTLDFETLVRIANVANGVVRADAIRRGVTLPIWLEGKVCFADPKTGEVFAAEPKPAPPSENIDPQAALDRDDGARLDALRALGIVLPFDAAAAKPTAKAKRTRADND